MSHAKCPHILSCKPPISLKKHKLNFKKKGRERRFAPFTILVCFGGGEAEWGETEPTMELLNKHIPCLESQL